MKVLIIVVAVALAAFFAGRYESGNAERPTPIAENVNVGPLGDADCDGMITSRDALAILGALSEMDLRVESPWPSCGIGLTVTGDIYGVHYQPIH